MAFEADLLFNLQLHPAPFEGAVEQAFKKRSLYRLVARRGKKMLNQHSASRAFAASQPELDVESPVVRIQRNLFDERLAGHPYRKSQIRRRNLEPGDRAVPEIRRKLQIPKRRFKPRHRHQI